MAQLNHLAIIPDGNRRWAKLHRFDWRRGHEAGAQNLKEVLEVVYEQKISCFSFWAASINNLLFRPVRERNYLERLCERHFNELAESEKVHARRAKIRILGLWRRVIQRPGAIRALERCMEVTKDYDAFSLNFFIAYDGREEILDAIARLVEHACNNPAEWEKYKRRRSRILGRLLRGDLARIEDYLAETERVLKNQLYTRELPPVDFLVRTGSGDEPHLSAGFLMYDMAECQLAFSERLWPDYCPDHLLHDIEDYHRRQRRHGR